MKFSVLLALTCSLVVASLALASSKSKSHKKEKSSSLRSSKSKTKSKQQLSESNPIEAEQAAPTWIAATSYGTDSTCEKKEPLPPPEGSWAYKSFPLGVCVPSSSGDVKSSFKYEYVSDSQGKYTTYTDENCGVGENSEMFNIGSCKPIASGSTHYHNLHYRTHAAGDYYAPMMWTYYHTKNDCDIGNFNVPKILFSSRRLHSHFHFAAIGEAVDISNAIHGYATYSYPDPDCWLDYPMIGNISHVKTFGKHLKYCTGYTNNECSDARTKEDNVPHCHVVNSCSTAYHSKEFGEYYMSFNTFKATEDDDIGDTPMIGDPH